MTSSVLEGPWQKHGRPRAVQATLGRAVPWWRSASVELQVEVLFFFHAGGPWHLPATSPQRTFVKDSINIGQNLRKMSRARAEVIQEWVDFDAAGSSFERGRMEANIQSICFKDPAGAPESLRNMHHGVKVKAPAVAFLVRAVTSYIY